jgi:signal transduction histidine kinase
MRESQVLEVTTVSMNQNGFDAGDLVILHDISREKTIERLKTEFVSLAAHQLRTPLSAIKWSLRMLIDGDLGRLKKEQREIVEKTQQSNDRMINLINDLLNVARIEEGRYLINPTRVNLVQICRKAIAVLGDSFKRKGLKFSFRLLTKKPASVFVDEEKIVLAVQNLLDNALKYTPAGGQISLSLKEVEDGVLIEVRDTGIGIAPEKQGRVFGKFFRAPEAVLLEPSGTGLGLYMTKNIVEGHGGRIQFESRPHQGARFSFFLPRAKKKIV